MRSLHLRPPIVIATYGNAKKYQQSFDPFAAFYTEQLLSNGQSLHVAPVMKIVVDSTRRNSCSDGNGVNHHQCTTWSLEPHPAVAFLHPPHHTLPPAPAALKDIDVVWIKMGGDTPPHVRAALQSCVKAIEAARRAAGVAWGPVVVDALEAVDSVASRSHVCSVLQANQVLPALGVSVPSTWKLDAQLVGGGGGSGIAESTEADPHTGETDRSSRFSFRVAPVAGGAVSASAEVNGPSSSSTSSASATVIFKPELSNGPHFTHNMIIAARSTVAPLILAVSCQLAATHTHTDVDDSWTSHGDIHPEKEHTHVELVQQLLTTGKEGGWIAQEIVGDAPVVFKAYGLGSGVIAVSKVDNRPFLRLCQSLNHRDDRCRWQTVDSQDKELFPPLDAEEEWEKVNFRDGDMEAICHRIRAAVESIQSTFQLSLIGVDFVASLPTPTEDERGDAVAACGAMPQLHVLDINYFPSFRRIRGAQSHLLAHFTTLVESARSSSL